MSNKKTSSAKKAGRPPKEPPRGTLGWRIREARKKSGLGPTEIADRVGLTDKMISAGELHSNFSESVLRLLAMELQDSFGRDDLKQYAREGVILQYYRGMSPKVRQTAATLLARLRSGEELPTGNYGDE